MVDKAFAVLNKLSIQISREQQLQLKRESDALDLSAIWFKGRLKEAREM